MFWAGEFFFSSRKIKHLEGEKKANWKCVEEKLLAKKSFSGGFIKKQGKIKVYARVSTKFFLITTLSVARVWKIKKRKEPQSVVVEEVEREFIEAYLEQHFNLRGLFNKYQVKVG